MTAPREAACDGKVAFESHAAALEHLHRLRKRRRYAPLKIYQCPYCHQWHTGHTDRKGKSK